MHDASSADRFRLLSTEGGSIRLATDDETGIEVSRVGDNVWAHFPDGSGFEVSLSEATSLSRALSAVL